MQETPVCILGSGRSAGEVIGYPLHYSTYSSLENSMDCIVHGVTKSWIQLSDFHFHSMKATYQPLTDSSYLLLTVLLL